MEVTSTYRHARISPYKAQQVTREIQGLPVATALDILTFTPKKAAHLVGKTLKSAIANAENNFDLMAEGLVVKSAVVGAGPVFKRFKARARGSAAPIKKRTSHIYIVLTDEIEVETREPKKKAAAKKKAPAKKAAAKKAPKTEAKPAVKADEKPAEKAKEAAPATPAKSEAPAGTSMDPKKGLVYDTAPDVIDDLKEISGVGPVLEEKLHEHGIYTFDQVAQWKKTQIAEFSDLLSFPDRIERDDWVSQAKKLSTDKK